MFPTSTTVGARPTPLIEPAPLMEKSTVPVNPIGAAMRSRLIYEALSRARMRRPQADIVTSSEAYRPARQIAMQARHRAAREQGIL